MRIRSQRKGERGQAVLEFALVIPVLMLVILGILAFGQLFSYLYVVNNAAREGARVGVTGRTDAQIQQTVLDRTQNLPGAPGAISVSITPSPEFQRIVGEPLTVVVRYSANIRPDIVGVFSGSRNIVGRTTMRVERLP